MSTEVEKKKRPRYKWDRKELYACVYAYRSALIQIEALADQSDGESRVQVIEILAREESKALKEFAHGRTKKSFEPRMQNISHLLMELGLATLERYPPLPNVGARIKPDLLRMINEVWDRTSVIEQPTADPEAFRTRLESALSKVDLEKFPPRNPRSGERTKGIVRPFLRDPNIAAWVLQKANGRCEACDTPAPFLRDDNRPYLEVHHVRPLSDGGPDGVDNAIGVCPTCHRRFHHGAGKGEFRRATIEKITRLFDYPATISRRPRIVK